MQETYTWGQTVIFSRVFVYTSDNEFKMYDPIESP